MSHLVDNYFDQKRVRIYNNIGELDGIKGRIDAYLEICPKPVVAWEFETLTDSIDQFGLIFDGKRIEAGGVGLEIKGIRAYSASEASASGAATEAVLGDGTKIVTNVRAFFVNMKCEENSIRGFFDIEGGKHIQKDFTDTVIELSDKVKISLSSPSVALNWIKNRSSTGFNITSCITLYSDKPYVELNSAYIDRFLKCITFMSNFASGGYVYPAIVQCHFVSNDIVEEAYRRFLSSSCEPIESFGQTWMQGGREIGEYFKLVENIYPLYESKDIWYDLNTCILWYFQSIQSRELPIVANALGSALERIAYVHLVSVSKSLTLQEWQSKKSLESKVISLCKNLGMIKIVNKSLINEFARIRNDSTHSLRSNDLPPDKGPAIRQALQIFEEAMLSIIGYDGRYNNRESEDSYQKARYKTIKYNP